MRECAANPCVPGLLTPICCDGILVAIYTLTHRNKQGNGSGATKDGGTDGGSCHWAQQARGANTLAKIFTKVTYRNKLLLFRLPTYFDVSYFFYYRAPFVPPKKKLGAHFVASDPGTENPSYATVQRCIADFAPGPLFTIFGRTRRFHLSNESTWSQRSVRPLEFHQAFSA